MNKLSSLNKNKTIQVITQILKNFDDIIAAYLFGSFPHEKIFNDIDILVLFKKKHENLYLDFEITHLIAESLEINSEKIDLLPFDLKKVNPMILIQAVNNGMLLKNNSDELLTDQIEKLSQYFLENESCLYYRNKYLKELYSKNGD